MGSWLPWVGSGYVPNPEGVADGVMLNPFRVGCGAGPTTQGSPQKTRATLGCLA